MTHTVTDVRTENWGSQMVEVQVVDITSLSSAGSESGVSPSRIDNVDTFTGHSASGTGEFVAWDETNGALKLLDNTGTQVGSGTSVGEVVCAWIGDR